MWLRLTLNPILPKLVSDNRQLPVCRIKKIDICGGKECMKKELRILVILIAVLLVGTVGYYFMPKKFGKNVNPSEVDYINVA